LLAKINKKTHPVEAAFIIAKKARTRGEGVDVMRDKELKLEEVESSHTLGGAGEG
jgi:hypothetical protein